MAGMTVAGVSFSGPLFDGQSLRIVAAMMKDINETLARSGLEFVRDQFDANFVNPTGAYESHVTYENRRPDIVITDHGVVYGPWLEGTGSRNQTTRFKGYWSFRSATRQLNEASEMITAAVVQRYVRQLNGET